MRRVQNRGRALLPVCKVEISTLREVGLCEESKRKNQSGKIRCIAKWKSPCIAIQVLVQSHVERWQSLHSCETSHLRNLETSLRLFTQLPNQMLHLARPLVRQLLKPTLRPRTVLLARQLTTVNPVQSSSSTTASPPSNSTPQALLAYYSQWPTRRVELQDLTMYGAPPLDEKTLLESAERTRKELLAGLARRVSDNLS